MPSIFDLLPDYIKEILRSEEFVDFLMDARQRFSFTGEQEEYFDILIFELYRDKDVAGLEKKMKERFGFDERRLKELIRLVLLNIVLPFPTYFGEQRDFYRSLGGDPEKDASLSKTTLAFQRILSELMRERADALSRMDFNKEAQTTKQLFAKNLTIHFFAPDAPYKRGLNDTIIALLMRGENYHEELLEALYQNEENIGDTQIALSDGSVSRPTVASWIKDFLGVAGGHVSSIEIAKYLSGGKNINLLEKEDQRALQRLLETFSVLKNFPESFEKTPPEQWMVIPYRLPDEETTKVPRKEKETSLDPGLRRDDKTAQTPTITVVPAPEPQAMAKPVLPLREASLDPGLRRDDRGDRNKVKIDFSLLTDEVIAKTGVILSGDVAERVKKILETRIRNVRNDIDTKGRLMAPVAEGGAGLGVEEADKMLAEAKNALQMVAEGKIDEYAPKKAGEKGLDSVNLDPGLRRDDREARDDNTPKMVIKEVDGVPTLVEKTEKKMNGKKEEKGVDNLSLDPGLRRDDNEVPHEGVHEEVHEIPGTGSGTGERGQAPTFAKASARQEQKLSQTPTEPDPKQTPPVKVPPHLEDAKVIPVMVKTMGAGAGLDPRLRGDDRGGRDNKIPQTPRKVSPVSTSAIGAQKKPIPDVKAPPRLVTVVDELRALSMKDIRRISQDTKAACQKIADKINALAKESLSKRAEAINAWKESPAYALYLEIGQLNISQDMAKLAEERKAAGKEYLTAEEFDALLDLNEKLRF